MDWAKNFVFVLVDAAISLGITYLLFKKLKATAAIFKEGKYKFGGAIAGFIALFVLFFYVFQQLESDDQKIRAREQEIASLKEQMKNFKTFDYWTVNGIVKRNDGIPLNGISVAPMPLTQVVTDPSGYYSLGRVMIVGENWPRIRYSGENLYMRVMDLAGGNAKKNDVDKTIWVDDVVLEAIH